CGGSRRTRAQCGRLEPVRRLGVGLRAQRRVGPRRAASGFDGREAPGASAHLGAAAEREAPGEQGQGALRTRQGTALRNHGEPH
ncbi:MAG: hypothetical protein ACREUT_06955, partial [Steroidobacteraceae bacterium]